MARPSTPEKIPYGAAKLCQDMATLVNNRQGSDIQFKVGGSTHDESSTVTLYAHSVILRCRSRYFAAMLDEEKGWKESTNGVIYKPNISPSTFEIVLHYIYTGDVLVKSSDNIIELITAADEMGLEELSTECQEHLIRTVKRFFFGGLYTWIFRPVVDIDTAMRTHIIPTLNLANNHSLSHLSQKLFAVILPNISMILKSPDAYTTFVNEISSETLAKIIASDDLVMSERNVWDLVLSWGCHQTKLSKTAVEAYLRKPEDGDETNGEESSNETVISDVHLSQLKAVMAPLLPAIRFSLLDPDDHYHILDILSYFMSRRRLSELHRFFLSPDCTVQLDALRNGTEQKVPSLILTESISWNILRKNIFKAGGIIGCSSLNRLQFVLLFRASEHGFLSTIFHYYCDDEGPTLVLVRSADGHLFGGVNFNHWKSDYTWSSSPLNFLFAFPDGCHRKDPVIFRIENQTQVQYSSSNDPMFGPIFGNRRSDLCIADSANVEFSHSNLPYSYNGPGASNTALAGASKFTVSDYEVFAIRKG